MSHSRDEVNKALDAAFAEAPWPFGGEPQEIPKEECGAMVHEFFLADAEIVRYLLPRWLKLAIDP